MCTVWMTEYEAKLARGCQRYMRRWPILDVDEALQFIYVNGIVGRGSDKYYVYAWYDCDDVFYIGKGCGLRALAAHIKEDRYLQQCERVRLACGDFTVRIIQNRLFEADALQLESEVIREELAAGRQLANVLG